MPEKLILGLILNGELWTVRPPRKSGEIQYGTTTATKKEPSPVQMIPHHHGKHIQPHSHLAKGHMTPLCKVM
jgi:hypothetical protein